MKIGVISECIFFRGYVNVDETFKKCIKDKEKLLKSR